MLNVGEFVASASAGLDPRPPGSKALASPEVEHLHVFFRRDLHVRRLQIAMDDAFLVRGLERLTDLVGELQRVLKR